MQRKSIYKYAAEAGVPVGIYLSMMSTFMLLSVKMPLLSSFMLPMTIGFPFYLGYILKRIGKSEPSFMKFSSLWLGGIYTVIFGTLICMLFTAVYMIWIQPGFIDAYFSNMIAAIESSSLSEEYGGSLEALRNMKENHLLPTVMDFVTTMGWFTCFSGSILSLFLALIISRTSSKVQNNVVSRES